MWAYEFRSWYFVLARRNLENILYYSFIVLLTVIDSVWMLSQSLFFLCLTSRDVSKICSRDIVILSLEVSWMVINHWVPQAKYTLLAIIYTRNMANISSCFVVLCDFSPVALLKARSIWRFRSSKIHHAPQYLLWFPSRENPKWKLLNKRTMAQIRVILEKIIMNFDLENNVLSGNNKAFTEFTTLLC